MTATHALLMTDLVDSTGTTERLGAELASRLWEQHDRLARDLLEVWRGHEIDKSDGFLLRFDTVADAAGYALAYHRAIDALPTPLRARAGVHVASLTLRPNTEADIARGAKAIEVDAWLAKALTARTMALARGGQTLLTSTAAAALAGSPLEVRELGHWRFQGIAEPIEVFEVRDGGVPPEPPADSAKAYRVVLRDGLWLPRRELRHTLPAERDAFIGREAALHDLAERLHRGARLVSVLGIGGTGKTRLALRFGWNWLGDYPGGVWFCDLASARSLDGIAYAVAQGLELPLGRADPLVQIGTALAGRGACLLILDNFEQIAALAEASVGAWLAQAPQARFIVTTREVLGIVGEQTLALAPLPASDAAALFIKRAADAGRLLAGADEAAVAPLVELLDGLPLAIELAAARTRVLAPPALLARMSERFRLLTSRTGRLERQATLRAALDWSWELLATSDKSALAQLSVFEGGFTLVEAEAVLDLSAHAGHRWAVDAVQSLVEKSMLRELGGGRFDLLRSVQAYAGEHLQTPGRFEGSGESLRAAAEARHWRHFAALDERAATADGCAAADNLVVACRRATAAADTAAATGALAAAWAVLRLTGPFRVALELGQLVCRLPTLSRSEGATALRIVGSANEMLGHTDEARAGLDAALIEARASGEPAAEAWVLCSLGEHLYKRGDADRARDLLTRACDVAAGLGLKSLQCTALNAIGTLETRLGRAGAARASYEQALALAREVGDLRWEGGLLGNLATLSHDEAGAHERARAQYEQALDLARQVRDRRWEGNARCNLGLLHQEQGRSAEAQLQFQMALAMAREMGLPMLEATVLCNLGIVLESRGAASDACDSYEAAVEVARRLGDRRAEGQFRGYLGACCAHLGRAEDATAHLTAGEALLSDVSDRVSLALLLCQRALVEHRAGQEAAARATLARADSLVDRTQPNSELARRLNETAALILAR